MTAHRPPLALLVLAAAPMVAAASVSSAQASAPAAAPAATTTGTRPTGVLRSVDTGAIETIPGWTLDDGWIGGDEVEGSPATWPQARAGEAPPDVASNSRIGSSFTYTLRRLEPGTRYTLRLHFYEAEATAAGQRTMNVAVNGTRALSAFDIFAAAGGRNIQVHRDVTAVADADGRVTIDFAGVTGKASIAGIQVIGDLPYTRLGSYLQLKDIRVRPLGPTSTHLSWRTVPGIAQYAVLRDGKIVGRTTEGAYVDSGATAGRTHRYTVAGIDPDGSLGLMAKAQKVTMPAAAARATGAYHVEGTKIIDPQGRVFVPVGANLGARLSHDGAGAAAGHAADAKAAGWNTVRIIVNPMWWDEDALRSLVAEYRAQGIVVMLDAHMWWEATDPEAEAKKDRVVQMWSRLAPEYKSDSGVWFNIANEPGYQNDEWYEFNARLAQTVRNAGAKNIMVVDAPSWGQDLGSVVWFAGSRYAYSPTMAPQLAAEYSNVILGQHNYGGWGKYVTNATYGAYVDKVHANGIPLVSNEFGYTIDGSTTAGSYELNKAGAKAVFAVNPTKGVGTIVWNGNTGDRYSLKKDGSAFWVGGVANNLSELGQDMWNLTH